MNGRGRWVGATHARRLVAELSHAQMENGLGLRFLGLRSTVEGGHSMGVRPDM